MRKLLTLALLAAVALPRCNKEPRETEVDVDTHVFETGYFEYYGLTETEGIRNYYLRLDSPGLDIESGNGFRASFDLYAPGDSDTVVPDGTYTVGGMEAWQIEPYYSSLIEYPDGEPSFDDFASGTVTILSTGEDRYKIVIDVITESGVVIKSTFEGVLPIYSGED